MLNRFLILGLAMGVVQFCSLAETKASIIISVDFSTLDASEQNTGYSPNRVEDGFSDFSYGPETPQSTSDRARLYPPLITKTFGSIQVTVSDPFPVSNGLFFVDEGTVSGTYGKLAEDFVVPSGLDLQVSLSGLAAGSYSMTTYHHRPSLTSQYNLKGITIDTGTGAVQVAQNVPVSIGYSPSSVGSAVFQFSADGVNNVVMTVQGNSVTTAGLLNGFEVRADETSAVPEPSSALLMGVGALGLLICRIRRRRHVAIVR